MSSLVRDCNCDASKEEFYGKILESLGQEDFSKEEHYPWDQCIEDNKDKGMDAAKKICGSIKAKSGESYIKYLDTMIKISTNMATEKDIGQRLYDHALWDFSPEDIKEAGMKDEDSDAELHQKAMNHIKTKAPKLYKELGGENEEGDREERDGSEDDRDEKDVEEGFVEYGKIKVTCETCNNYTTLPDKESAISYAKEHKERLGYAHNVTFE